MSTFMVGNAKLFNILLNYILIFGWHIDLLLSQRLLMSFVHE